MARVIRFFRISDESFAGEFSLANISDFELKRIFLVSDDDPMFDSYPITHEQSEKLRLYCELDFDFQKYDYFLEFES